MYTYDINDPMQSHDHFKYCIFILQNKHWRVFLKHPNPNTRPTAAGGGGMAAAAAANQSRSSAAAGTRVVYTFQDGGGNVPGTLFRQ